MKCRVLVVDDDASVRMSVRWTLEGRGYGVEEACDGKSAMRLLEREPIQLVITDILMPEMDGLELIRQMRRHHSQVTVIAISGGGFFCKSDLYLKLSLGCGAVRFIEKPFVPNELLEAVSSTLGTIPNRGRRDNLRFRVSETSEGVQRE